MPGKAEELWKKSLLTLPDTVFFALMRNYLGGIHTPFNKHDLIRDLTAFIRDPDTQERIIALLDNTDRAVLTAIGFLESVSPENLYKVLRGNIPFGEVMRCIASLRERLLIYAQGEDSNILLKLNPVLGETLQAGAVGFDFLFRSIPGSFSGAALRLNEHLLTGLIAFIHANPEALDADGGVRKKNISAFKAAFPGLSLRKGRSEEAAAVIRGCKALGILSEHESILSFHPGVYEEFLSLPAAERRLVLYSHTAFSGAGEPPEADAITGAFMRIIGSFPPERAIDEKDASGFLALCFLAQGVRFDPVPALQNLLLLQVFLRNKEGCVTLNPEFPLWLESSEEGQQVRAVFQPNFDLLLPESAPAQTLSSIPRLFHLKKQDRFAEYTLTQDSFIGYLDSGGTGETAEGAIENITGTAVPGNTITTLKLWEEKYRSIRIYEGTVLKISKDMEPFLQHSPVFASAVREHLGNGIYYLGDIAAAELREVLIKSGVSHPPGRTAHPSSISGSRSSLRRPAGAHHTPPRNLYSDDAPPKARLTAPAVLKELKKSLREQSLPAVLVKEFENRIERRLILHPRQFSRDIDRQRQKEARGIDYPGKIRLIEEALKAGSALLEIPAETGSEDMMVVKPISLSRSGGDSVLTALILPEETNKNLPVRKISKIRLLSGYLIPSSL